MIEVQKAHSVRIALFLGEFLTSHTLKQKKSLMKNHSKMLIRKAIDSNYFPSGSPKTPLFQKLNEFFNHEVKSYRRISEIHLIKKITLSLSK